MLACKGSVASQSILFRIIGITMFMCLAIVNMVTCQGKVRGGHDDDHNDGHDRGGHGGGHGRGHNKD